MNATDDHFLRIMADEASLGGNQCLYEKDECAFPKVSAGEAMTSMSLAPEMLLELEELAREEADELPDPLGPSLLRKLRQNAAPEALLDSDARSLIAVTPPGQTHLACAGEANSYAYCTKEAHSRADAAGEEYRCIQRQELRLNGKKRRPHATKDPLWYSIRFRMPSSIEDRCNSVRWVTAQRKHKGAALAKDYTSQNPFLAQRFDDGILHVTVQDEGCRCLVASARDPSRSVQEVWNDGPVPENRCSSNTDIKECAGRFTLDYSDDPVLINPLGEWTTMQYFVKPSQRGDGKIIVQQDGHPIVTITGNIGYRIADESKNTIKFKFGHYRDYMPFHNEMDIYSVKIDDQP